MHPQMTPSPSTTSHSTIVRVPCDQEEARSLQTFDSRHWFREIDTIMYIVYYSAIIYDDDYISAAGAAYISYNCIHDVALIFTVSKLS